MRKLCTWTVAMLLTSSAAFGAGSIREGVFEGRRAWILTNGLIEVAVLAGGGHIAGVRLVSSDPKKNVNPMRVPHYRTIEPYDYNDARDNPVYGDTPHRRLSSGYMGHLLCFPIYGPPSDAEARAGLGNHGEAPVVEWRKQKQQAGEAGVTLWYGADLPISQYRVEREITVPAGLRVVRVREWVENRTAFDRAMNWMEHATFGPPFIEPGKTVLEVSATEGQVVPGRPGTGSLQPGSAVQWPRGVGPDGRTTDLRVFQPKPHSGTYCALRLDPGRDEQFFALYHPAYRVLIGYVFPAAATPWIADWQENRSNNTPPWNGQVVARGIEWGDTPYAEGLRKSVERGSMLGARAYGWIGARERLERRFTIILAEIDQGFGGLRDLRLKDGAPVLTPR